MWRKGVQEIVKFGLLKDSVINFIRRWGSLWDTSEDWCRVVTSWCQTFPSSTWLIFRIIQIGFGWHPKTTDELFFREGVLCTALFWSLWLYFLLSNEVLFYGFWMLFQSLPMGFIFLSFLKYKPSILLALNPLGVRGDSLRKMFLLYRIVHLDWKD